MHLSQKYTNSNLYFTFNADFFQQQQRPRQKVGANSTIVKPSGDDERKHRESAPAGIESRDAG